MKIVVLGNFKPDKQESMLRFGAMLHDGFAARGHDVSIISPPPVLARLAPEYRYGGVPKYLGYLDKFVLFPSRLKHRLRAERPDVVHIADQANAVYATAHRNQGIVATCHDMLQIQAALGEIPSHRLQSQGRRYQHWILRHLARVPHVGCVSHHTAGNLIRLTGMSPDRVKVIPNALNYPYRARTKDFAWQRLHSRWPTERSRPEWLTSATGGFILNVGGGQWYKNRPGLLKIFAGLQRELGPPAPKLVMVGKPLSRDDEQLAQTLGIAQEITLLSDVSNEDLEALYSASEGLLFPSLNEGFGWPIAEAQACGCPVFTSDRPPMTEVGGESALYFDPEAPEAAAKKIAAGWGSRSQLAQLGLKEAQRWSLDLMLDAYEALYREGVASPPLPVKR